MDHDKMTDEEFQKQYQFPHCDSDVLHAPSVCEYCDRYPQRQQERIAKKINFTGQNDPDKEKCPAEKRRSLSNIERWYGNVAYPTKIVGPDDQP